MGRRFRSAGWMFGVASAVVPQHTVRPVLSSPAARPVMAFVDVTVIPMDRERLLRHQTVLVREARIVALGSVAAVPVPAHAVRIDGQGKYLIPGLADMHAHLSMGWWTHPKYPPEVTLFRFVAEGVTTIRDMWGAPWMLGLKAQAAAGTIVSPRLYVSIRPGGAGLARLSTHPDSAVSLAQRAGFDFLKFWSAPTGVELDSILTVARRVGLPIAGHPPNDDNLLAIQEGYRSVEHLLGFWHRDEAKLRATAVALRQAGVWVCPTLAHTSREHASRGPREHLVDTAVLYHAIKVLHDVGVGLLAGTDGAFGPGPGHFLADEVAALTMAGLTPYEALATATRNPAAYFGTLDSTGTVGMGKRADLVLLNGNPLTDARYVAQPAGVMVRGQWLSRGELDQIAALLPPLPEGPYGP